MKLKIILLQRLKSKNLSKYIASFECFDKSLIVLSVATGDMSTASFATVIGAPTGIMTAVVALHFQLLQDCKKTIKNNKK